MAKREPMPYADPPRTEDMVELRCSNGTTFPCLSPDECLMLIEAVAAALAQLGIDVVADPQGKRPAPTGERYGNSPAARAARKKK